MTSRTRKSLFIVAAAVLALSSFAAAIPIPTRSDQLVISPEGIVPSEDVGLFVPDHDCGHDESDYENPTEDDDDDNDDTEDEDDEDDDDELEAEDEQEESTEEDLQAAGESEDDYYIGQTYTGLVFDSNTGKGIALTTVDPDQDLLELALFMRRKKISSFEEIWSDIENSEGSEDGGFEDDEAIALAASDLNDIESMDDDDEEDVFESET
jgi:hypothetical protein